MKASRIHIYNRHYSRNKKHPCRPDWFNYEKAFVNLLSTIDFGICDLTVIFEKEDDYPFYFIKKYENKYPFSLKFIKTDELSWKDKGLSENQGWCRSIAAAAEVIHNDKHPPEDLIMISDDDFLYIPDWVHIAMDWINNFLPDDGNWWLCPCDCGDKYFFIDENETIDSYGTNLGMYKSLTSKIRISNFRYWRSAPNCLTSSIIPVKTFERDYSDYWSKGYSDCSLNKIISDKYGTVFWTPMPSLSCHCLNYFLPPFIDWKRILSDIII